MRIIIDISHPKGVNVFKNVIWKLERKGHAVKITARNKEVTLAKLDAYGFDYESGKHYKGLLNKAIGIFKNDLWLLKVSKKFKPDIFVSLGSPYAAHVSKLLGKPHIAFSDVEGANLNILLMLPFTNDICVPTCFDKNLGSKEVRYNSYLELAYLHPNNFKPNSSVLESLNLSKHNKYILMRISSLDSSHDIGAKGFVFKSTNDILEFIQKLYVYGNIFLTSEIKLGSELDEYQLKIPINDLQSCISFATMYIGDGASMAAEAAILGVPSIYITNNTRRWGFIKDLEKNYGLLYTFSTREQALEKAIELLDDPNLKEKWQKKREKMLSEKIDAAKFITEFIENHERK